MSLGTKIPAEPAEDQRGLLALALLSLLAGAAAGLVGAIFRLSFDHADRMRDALVSWAHGETLAGFVLVTSTCTAATAVAAWLVRRYSPYACLLPESGTRGLDQSLSQ